VIPFQVAFYYDAACTHVAVTGTVTTYTANDTTGTYHLTASAVYTSPTGIPQGTLALDEQANGAGLNHIGTMHALGTYTSLTGGPTVQFGFACNNLSGSHNVGICEQGIVQNFPGLTASYGSVATLGLDSTSAGVLTLSGSAVLTSGASGALALTVPDATSLLVTGGTNYGTAVDAGSAASFTLYPPTPTGWTVTDATDDQLFTISLVDNITHHYSGTVKRISTGATLASFTLDQSGSGSITYTDGSTASITTWIVSQ
jgi:hypothetical protein